MVGVYARMLYSKGLLFPTKVLNSYRMAICIFKVND